MIVPGISCAKFDLPARFYWFSLENPNLEAHQLLCSMESSFDGGKSLVASSGQWGAPDVSRWRAVAPDYSMHP